MTKVRVYVAYKASILDPQAQAIQAATHKMGYQEVTELNVGKFSILILMQMLSLLKKKPLKLLMNCWPIQIWKLTPLKF